MSQNKGCITWNTGIKLNRVLYPNMGHFQKHSEKSKKKISEAKLNKAPWNKDKIGVMPIPWNKGKQWFAMRGKNNPCWKGGFNRKAYMKQWNKDNPLRNKIYRHERRAAIKGLTLQTIQLVYENNIKKYGTLTCYLCLNPIPFGKDHLEHKIPLFRGGNNKKNNLGIACQQCNCKKHTKTESEYRKEVCH